jgi:hypothetical protein
VKERLAALLLVRPAGAAVIVRAGARVSIVQEDVASAPALPTASRPLTVNVWRPSGRFVYACGDTHAANAASLILHSNVAGSFDAKAKLAERLFVGSAGLSLIAVAGPVVSIVQLWIVAGPVPAAPVALTANVCAPSARPV